MHPFLMISNVELIFIKILVIFDFAFHLIKNSTCCF